jgi:chemotaxis protein histidine kinase CheA
MPEQDNGLIHEFALEVAEHVEASERLLVRAATDALSSDEINLLFRSFHSVKGLARVVDCAPLERLAHATESLLSPVRDGERPLDQTLQDLLLQSLDAIRGARGALLDGAPVQPDEAFLASLDSTSLEECLPAGGMQYMVGDAPL